MQEDARWQEVSQDPSSYLETNLRTPYRDHVVFREKVNHNRNTPVSENGSSKTRMMARSSQVQYWKQTNLSANLNSFFSNKENSCWLGSQLNLTYCSSDAIPDITSGHEMLGLASGYAKQVGSTSQKLLLHVSGYGFQSSRGSRGIQFGIVFSSEAITWFHRVAQKAYA